MTNILLDCKRYFYNFEIREEQCRFATGVDGRVIRVNMSNCGVLSTGLKSDVSKFWLWK